MLALIVASALSVSAEDELSALSVKEHLAAIGAFFLKRKIPRGELTLGIPLTAIEHAACSTVLNDHAGAAIRASDTNIGRFLLGKAAGRII